MSFIKDILLKNVEDRVIKTSFSYNKSFKPICYDNFTSLKLKNKYEVIQK